MKSDKISLKQLMAMAYVGILSPAIRLMPGIPASLAGRGAWLSVIAALVPTLLYIWMMGAFLKNRQDGEGLGELMQRSVGKTAAAIILTLILLWLLFYTAFILRVASTRMLSTVYKSGDVAVFAVVTLLAAVLVAAGSIRGLARTAEVSFTIIIMVLAAVILLSLSDFKFENVYPVTYLDLKDVALGAIPVVDVAIVLTYFLFLAGHVPKKPGETKTCLRWGAYITVTMFAIVFFTIGAMGAGLAGKLQNSFFVMLRNLVVLEMIERMEAIVIAVWVITDVLFLASLLVIVTELGMKLLHKASRRLLLWTAAGITFVCALVMVPNAFVLNKLSEGVVPGINMIVLLVLLPAVLIIGKLRKKI